MHSKEIDISLLIESGIADERKEGTGRDGAPKLLGAFQRNKRYDLRYITFDPDQGGILAMRVRKELEVIWKVERCRSVTGGGMECARATGCDTREGEEQYL